MKKRIVFALLLLVVVGIAAALALSAEFRYLWQTTPVLSSVYSWVDGHFNTFISTVTESKERDVYLAVVGGLLISLFTVMFLNVKPVSVEEKYVNVKATPVIRHIDNTTVIVIEEK